MKTAVSNTKEEEKNLFRERRQSENHLDRAEQENASPAPRRKAARPLARIKRRPTSLNEEKQKERASPTQLSKNEALGYPEGGIGTHHNTTIRVTQNGERVLQVL